MTTPERVLVFPAWRDNPFLNLLALSARGRGSEFLGATTFSSLLAQLRRLGSGDVLHVHWTSPILQEAATEGEAQARLTELREAFTLGRARGVRTVWTIHNRLPHELRHRAAEIGLHSLLAKTADVIHVMAPRTSEVMADVVALPEEKVRVLPHPSYEGVYDTAIDRTMARDSFGLRARDRAALFLGQIRPYKGVDALVDAAALAHEHDPHLVLMLAGVVKDVATEGFARTLPAEMRTVTRFDFVEDGDIARWFHAADVMVLPYRAILNSGSLHLAATYRVPVILPDEPHLRDQFGGHRWVAFFDTARPAQSIAGLLADGALFAGLRPEEFTAFTDPISPWVTSERYAELLSDVRNR